MFKIIAVASACVTWLREENLIKPQLAARDTLERDAAFCAQPRQLGKNESSLYTCSRMRSGRDVTHSPCFLVDNRGTFFHRTFSTTIHLANALPSALLRSRANASAGSTCRLVFRTYLVSTMHPVLQSLAEFTWKSSPTHCGIACEKTSRRLSTLKRVKKDASLDLS